MSISIYAGNLSYSLTDDELRGMFSEFGEVVDVKIITDRETGRAKGFGFVEMENKDDAESAIAALDGKELQGRNMKVNLAKPKTDNRGGGRNRW